MIDLSIIIVNYNGEHFLRDCLISLKNSVHHLNYEIIFVDNGSTDNSLPLLKELAPEARLIQNEENRGFCKANNQGLAIYRGRYALLLNTDTIVTDGALDRMVAFMDANPKVGALGPKLLNTDGTVQHQGGILAKKFWRSRMPLPVDYVIGAALLVRREVINRIGMLDENFFFSNEDLDWCRRMRKNGWPVYFFPQAEIIHHGGFTVKRFSRQTFVEGFRGGLYFARKHYGPLVYQIYRVLLILLLLPVIFFTLLLYPLLKNREKLAAYGEILRIAVGGKLTPRPPLFSREGEKSFVNHKPTPLLPREGKGVSS